MFPLKLKFTTLEAQLRPLLPLSWHSRKIKAVWYRGFLGGYSIPPLLCREACGQCKFSHRDCASFSISFLSVFNFILHYVPFSTVNKKKIKKKKLLTNKSNWNMRTFLRGLFSEYYQKINFEIFSLYHNIIFILIEYYFHINKYIFKILCIYEYWICWAVITIERSFIFYTSKLFWMEIPTDPTVGFFVSTISQPHMVYESYDYETWTKRWPPFQIKNFKTIDWT